MITDVLIRAIEQKSNPTVVGLDTQLSYLPDEFSNRYMQNGEYTLETASEAIYAYNCALLDALWELVPAVKVQVAYYEMYGPAGLYAFEQTLRYARAKGLITIADCKRNDIGATAGAYATAYLGRTQLGAAQAKAFSPDFLTVTPYLGEDGVKPFVEACAKEDHGIFVLVKTSNPSSGQLQDLLVEGIPIWQHVGSLVASWGKNLVGKYGYSAVGAVVGATYPEQGKALRALLPHTFFLVPGYGAQGASAADLAGCFDSQGRGAVVNASRSVLCAWQKQPNMPFAQAARQEVERMRNDIHTAIGR